MAHDWVKAALKDVGKTQRDLAQAWGVSEGSVSKWMSGQESQDPPLSRVVKLALMLGMDLTELAKRLGGYGELAASVATVHAANRGKAVPITPPTMSLDENGKTWVLMHIEVPFDVAVELLNLTKEATSRSSAKLG